MEESPEECKGQMQSQRQREQELDLLISSRNCAESDFYLFIYLFCIFSGVLILLSALARVFTSHFLPSVGTLQVLF